MSKPCEFCGTKQWGGKVFLPENPLIPVYVHKNTLCASTDEMAMNFKINYCPMCGDKLEADNG